jgi:hypothetical protein
VDEIKFNALRTSKAFNFELRMHRLLILLMIWVTTDCFSQTGTGNFSFTQIPVSPLSAAMGGFQVAGFRGDVAQITDNPAFIDSAMHQSVSLSYLNYLSTINQASLAYAHRFDSLGFGSVYLRYLDYGTFQEYDETGVGLGEFTAVDYELGLSFARNYAKGFTYGATLKQVFSNMYRYFAYGVAVDLGGYYTSPSKNLSIGLTVDDVGMKLVDYTSGSNEWFPWSVNLGVTKKFAEAPLVFGFQYSDIQQWDLAQVDQNAIDDVVVDELTAEVTRPVVTLDNFARHLSANVMFVPSEKFNLFLGYNFRRRLELSIAERPALVGFSFGAQIKIKRFGIQYGITNYHLNGTSNHIGITTNLNAWYSRKTAS